jgi:hypothetical protein
MYCQDSKCKLDVRFFNEVLAAARTILPSKQFVGGRTKTLIVMCLDDMQARHTEFTMQTIDALV